MQYFQNIIKGSQLDGARLLRLIEEGAKAVEELKALYPHTGNAFIIGITGPSGAGKSSLIGRLITEFRTREMKVGVLAIDPSSPFSGGAVLGDRLRMHYALDDKVFVHSMASRGHPGGISVITKEAVLVLDAMGYEIILIETIGAGQDEVEIANIVHSTGVVNIPGMGDGIQSIKAGILEIGDIFIVNKADKPEADELVNQLNAMIMMRNLSQETWRPVVIKTVAVENKGIVKLVDLFFEHRKYLIESGELNHKNADRQLYYFNSLVKEFIAEKISNSSRYKVLVSAIKKQKIDPYSAAEKLVKEALERLDK